MKKIILILLATSIFLTSCSKNSLSLYIDMYLSIEVLDTEGNDLLKGTNAIINQNKTKAIIEGKDYYLNSTDTNPYRFRHVQTESKDYLKIGYWFRDVNDYKVIIDWGDNIEKDVIIFSYDTHLNGVESSDHDFRYPHEISINGKELNLDVETGHYIYVKEIK